LRFNRLALVRRLPYKSQPLFIWNLADVTRSDRHSPVKLHRPRLLALPFVALCVLAYAGSVAHFTLVQHARCLEHGEVIHVGESQAHAQAPTVEDSAAQKGMRLTRAGAAAVASHDAEAHCAHTFFRREGLPPPVQLLLSVEALAVAGPAPMVEQVHPEPVARLLLAPKSSPPLS
jgi:hypothetical protein